MLWTDALLRFADVDYYGHVSNRAFSEILEGGRIAFIARHIEPKITADLFVVIARLTIDFWNEFSFPGGARTGTWLSKIGRTSATFDQAILGDNGLVGAATGVCVLVEKVSRRPTPFSDELRQSLQKSLRSALCKQDFGAGRPKRRRAKEENHGELRAEERGLAPNHAIDFTICKKCRSQRCMDSLLKENEAMRIGVPREIKSRNFASHPSCGRHSPRRRRARWSRRSPRNLRSWPLGIPRTPYFASRGGQRRTASRSNRPRCAYASFNRVGLWPSIPARCPSSEILRQEAS